MASGPSGASGGGASGFIKNLFGIGGKSTKNKGGTGDKAIKNPTTAKVSRSSTEKLTTSSQTSTSSTTAKGPSPTKTPETATSERTAKIREERFPSEQKPTNPFSVPVGRIPNQEAKIQNNPVQENAQDIDTQLIDVEAEAKAEEQKQEQYLASFPSNLKSLKRNARAEDIQEIGGVKYYIRQKSLGPDKHLIIIQDAVNYGASKDDNKLGIIINKNGEIVSAQFKKGIDVDKNFENIDEKNKGEVLKLRKALAEYAHLNIAEKLHKETLSLFSNMHPIEVYDSGKNSQIRKNPKGPGYIFEVSLKDIFRYPDGSWMTIEHTIERINSVLRDNGKLPIQVTEVSRRRAAFSGKPGEFIDIKCHIGEYAGITLAHRLPRLNNQEFKELQAHFQERMGNEFQCALNGDKLEIRSSTPKEEFEQKVKDLFPTDFKEYDVRYQFSDQANAAEIKFDNEDALIAYYHQHVKR